MPKYEPDFEPTEQVNLAKFPLQVAKIEIVPGKTGWSKYKITLPQSFRSLYYSDVLYGPDWRELIADFDKRLLSPTSQQHVFNFLTNSFLLFNEPSLQR